MASLNKVTIIGHLGRDPEIRHTGGGDAVANFSVATSRRWKDKASGEQREETTWFNCVAWGKLGEIAGEYLRKGRLVYVEGDIRTRKYTDRDGVERAAWDVNVQQMTLLDKAPDAAGGSEPRSAPASSSGYQRDTAYRKPAQAPAPARAPQGSLADMDDDIPFSNPYRGRASYVY